MRTVEVGAARAGRRLSDGGAIVAPQSRGRRSAGGVDRLPGRAEADPVIRVDRLPVDREHVLTLGCRVSVTPTKTAGAITLVSTDFGQDLRRAA